MRILLNGLILVIVLSTTTVFAKYIKTVEMGVVKSSPMVNNTRHADIDAVSNPLGGSKEIFCIERVPALKGVNKYDIYTVEDTAYYDKKGNNVTDTKVEQLTQAAWYADWFLNNSDGDDAAKAVAQIAIWETMGAISNYKGVFKEAVDSLMKRYKGTTDKKLNLPNWVVASSPGNRTPIIWGEGGQNFLIHMPKTPEPATIFSFGLGLLVLTNIYRRRTE